MCITFCLSIHGFMVIYFIFVYFQFCCYGTSAPKRVNLTLSCPKKPHQPVKMCVLRNYYPTTGSSSQYLGWSLESFKHFWSYVSGAPVLWNYHTGEFLLVPPVKSGLHPLSAEALICTSRKGYMVSFWFSLSFFAQCSKNVSKTLIHGIKRTQSKKSYIEQCLAVPGMTFRKGRVILSDPCMRKPKIEMC